MITVLLLIALAAALVGCYLNWRDWMHRRMVDAIMTRIMFGTSRQPWRML